MGGVIRASLWSGTAASWVDLHALLPPEVFDESQALGIWHDDANTFVVGHGRNLQTQRNEALMWVGPLPPALCTGDINGDGTVNVSEAWTLVAANDVTGERWTVESDRLGAAVRELAQQIGFELDDG